MPDPTSHPSSLPPVVRAAPIGPASGAPAFRSGWTPARLAGCVLALALIAAIGLACIVAPVLIRREPLMPAPLFPLVRTAVENLGWGAIALLAVLGFLAGMFTRLRPGWIGLASIATLPLAMVAELFADQTAHNLFPFELMMYALLSVPALLASMAGRWMRSRMRRT